MSGCLWEAVESSGDERAVLWNVRIKNKECWVARKLFFLNFMSDHCLCLAVNNRKSYPVNGSCIGPPGLECLVRNQRLQFTFRDIFSFTVCSSTVFQVLRLAFQYIQLHCQYGERQKWKMKLMHLYVNMQCI